MTQGTGHEFATGRTPPKTSPMTPPQQKASVAQLASMLKQGNDPGVPHQCHCNEFKSSVCCLFLGLSAIRSADKQQMVAGFLSTIILAAAV